MNQNRRESDLQEDLYSFYGNSRKLKPQRIKSFAVYKQLIENTKVVDNFVVAANDSNEISVSFSGGSDCKVFTFDKVFHSDVSQTEFCDYFAKSAVQDIILGLNSYLIVCKLASPCVAKIENKTSFFDMDSIASFTENFLKDLLSYTKKKENMDSSLHISYFEVHDDKIFDFLSSCQEYKDIEVFENSELNYVGIKDLVEKPLIDDKDISSLFTRQQSCSPVCYADCCHSILSVSLIRNDINSNGFEFIKIGKFTMVGFTNCKNFLGYINKSTEDCLLKYAENLGFPVSPKNKIFDILKPAFGRNSRTSVIVLLSSVLYSLEKDLSILQFVSDVRKTMNYPEIDLKLIIPNSLKEYAEEIKELQKDLNATSKSTGIMLESMKYSSYKNSISLENENVKALNNQLLSLHDAINSKNRHLISLHTTNETVETEIKEVGKSSESLKLDLEKMRNENNIIQKTSMKADEIIFMKQMKLANDVSIQELHLELRKISKNYEDLMQSCHYLNDEVTSLLCDIDAQQTSLKSMLELLIVDMNNTISEFQILLEDLTMKLNNLPEFDILLQIQKQNTESLLSRFSSFIDQYNENFNSIKTEMSSVLVPLHISENEILEIIRNNRNEKWPVLSYYFGKVKILCDSSFKILAEIMHQLDMIQHCYKAELKTIGVVFCSSSQAFKKFASDMSSTLKSFQQYFEDQEKELLQMTDIIYFHHKFKKQFDENIADIKNSLLALKQMCLSHNDATNSKWNELQKDSHKASQKHMDLSEHLSGIHKEVSKYVDSLSQQKLNALDYFPLKEKTDNVESRTHQLLQIYKEMKADVGEASEVYKKGTDKELTEIGEYLNAQRTKVEKYFDTYSLKLKTTSKSFLDEIKSIQQVFSSHKDDINKNLTSLLASVSSLAIIYDNYKSVCSNILEKCERSFRIMPPISEEKTDNLEFENFFLDEREFGTSTPNVPEKKELNLPYEKEKMLCRIKSLVEEQIYERINGCDFDPEGKRNRNCNISTMSLPNLGVHSKVPITSGKNFSKLKFSKKRV